jgi:hypothetical protein
MTKFAVAILLALTMPASAQDVNSANYYLPGCKGHLDPNSAHTWGRALCVAYLAGLVYGVGGKDFCAPDGATDNQVIAVVIKYIEARPERMHEQFGKLAIEALSAAWPCKR